ncbi:endonuclease/exonuclease/phosphatase family protein [Halioglobus maricola]|nr:endonuclease/exonuclease/phosphatase family protein [Halioglobus maricola]
MSLLFVLLMVGLGLANSRSMAREVNLCGERLGQEQEQAGQSLSSHLDILSWNIQKASNEGWAEDLAAMAGDVHLAFLQEASVQADIPSTLQGRDIYRSFTQGYSTASINTGVMTLSSHTPSMLCNFRSLEPWLGTPKTATVTEHTLEDRDERLLSINLHAVNFTFGIADLEKQLKPLAGLLAQHPGPAILAGDFNTWSEARQDLVDRVLASHGLNPIEFSDDQRTRAFGRPLDHIYVRGLSVEHTEVIPVHSSDHNALRARLVIE